MREAQALKSAAIKAISQAWYYLRTRPKANATTAERQDIQAWIERIENAQRTIEESGLAMFGLEEKDRAAAARIDRIGDRIRQLEETDEFGLVVQILSELDLAIRYFTVRGGPGAGNPSGRPGRGRPRSR